MTAGEMRIWSGYPMSYYAYHIIFTGEIRGRDKKQGKPDLCRKYRCHDGMDCIFSGRKVVLKRNLDQSKAADYIEMFEKIGMICHLEAVDSPEIDGETPSTTIERDHSSLHQIINSKLFLWTFLPVVVMISLILKNISVLMVVSLLSSVFLCHVVYMQKYTDDKILPPGFWSVNRIIGSILAAVYLYFSINASKIYYKFDLFSYLSSEFSGIYSVPYLSGVIYITFLPIFGILCMMYYDIVYTPENEMIRKGSNVASIIAGLYFIILGVFIFLAFL